MNPRESVAIVVANWRAFERRAGDLEGWEHLLYTDVHLSGEAVDGLGPYTLINTAAGPPVDSPTPAAVLRIWDALPDEPTPMQVTDTNRYHGGQLEDEVAALLSLEFGARMKPGPITRRFMKRGDPLGNPMSSERYGIGVPPFMSGGRSLVPSLTGTRYLGECFRFAKLCSIEDTASAVLVKAARLYQEAIWVVDGDPALAWLLLVTAVETAANQWRSGQGDPVARVRESRPDLATILLDAGGEDLLRRVSEGLAQYMGSTKKFVDFMIEFLPSPPTRRPPPGFEFDWSRGNVQKAMKAVYNYRSKALHDGTPFPYPMCELPRPVAANVAPAEVPSGLATAVHGGVWLAQDTPMVIHTFHHIARGALLGWWDSLISGA